MIFKPQFFEKKYKVTVVKFNRPIIVYGEPNRVLKMLSSIHKSRYSALYEIKSITAVGNKIIVLISQRETPT